MNKLILIPIILIITIASILSIVIFVESLDNSIPYDSVLNGATFYGNTHYDFIEIGKGMQSMQDIQLYPNDDIHVIFGQNNYTFGKIKYQPIPEFTHDQIFHVNDTFAIMCMNIGQDGFAKHFPDLQQPDLTSLSIVKYVGPVTTSNQTFLAFWHIDASLPSSIACEYPDIIEQSVNIWHFENFPVH